MPDEYSVARGSIVIRRREDEDLDACAAILRRVHAQDGYPVEGVDDAKGFLTHEGLQRTWVAELDSKIVGHIGQARPAMENNAARVWRKKYGDEPVAILRALFVDPRCRGHGVAEKLMLAVQDWGGQNGVRLVLNNLIKDQSAKRLYERLGWTIYGEAIHRYGDGEEMAVLLYVNPVRPDR